MIARTIHQPARTQAFSLVEVLTVVALLSFIIVGLMATFAATQRAWKSSMTQTDVLESGRMATDLITRDFLEITPVKRAGIDNFYVDCLFDVGGSTARPQVQRFTQEPAEVRNNELDNVFFLRRFGNTWEGIGYFVGRGETSDTLGTGLGTLFRYSTQSVSSVSIPAFEPRFTALVSATATETITPQLLVTNGVDHVDRIIDGVVHFAVNVYDPAGLLITNQYSTPNFISAPGGFLPRRWYTTFRSNAVPAFVEIELGILEARTLEQARAMPNAVARSNFVSRQIGHVQLFRQRIPIRNVDTEAYR